MVAPQVTRRLIAEFARSRSPRRKARMPELTQRERQALELVPSGLSHGEIAAQLFVSVATVKTHVRSLLANWIAETACSW